MKGPRDIAVILPNRPGALSEFGQVLGHAGVSLEGGGVFTHHDEGIAHFLVNDAAAALEALTSAGIGPVTVSPVVTVKLDQGTPGELGALAKRLGDGMVNILIQYSDHANRLVLVPEPGHYGTVHRLAREWMSEQPNEADSPPRVSPGAGLSPN
ncbi:hypothetical protein FYJ28_11545 [Arthrobacter sp. BL-252-APC-1A]|uniref:hypothetical protein n=1 Tax=Arthrobacter sp. BL-252-APC-1A TaxID=2606622 RepID=UPI0012B41AFE|nr:hypothetical protein [Arthrobacter sp. BL-252-APC-1A]MSR99452.1 hypothetical protein [Arthrobacter sp. BL-252-APC-1A]